jgi:hypothetical protein
MRESEKQQGTFKLLKPHELYAPAFLTTIYSAFSIFGFRMIMILNKDYFLEQR